ncbi:MAG: hypothetical protein GYB65_15010 [Chloroflexi bacterium]|nr:hypothetical protein [Chloroflexota bacterium]
MADENQNPLEKLIGFLFRLREERIYFTLEQTREAIMVQVVIPGERWEVEFFADGHVELERFISPGEIEDENDLNRHLERLAE